MKFIHVSMLVMLLLSSSYAQDSQTGSIRGIALDRDFELPLPGVQVSIEGSEQVVTTGKQGQYALNDLQPGVYSVVYSLPGYVSLFKGDVVVNPGALTDLNVYLAGDFVELDDFVVEDVLDLGVGSEIALLQLRFESPALMDSISSELMSRAGASDAASALTLVSGATLQDGKSAVIRGLPDRYVSSQLNSVRLPTADEDKRAVELDQFPSAVIESIQVTKTFTPDQQGDASGGAVNVLLKEIPDEPFLRLSAQASYNSQVSFNEDFLSYDGGGVGGLGFDDGGRDPQLDRLGENWDGAAGVSRTDAPEDYKWSLAGGNSVVLDSGARIGGSASLFYERDSSFYDDGIDDSYVVESPGEDPSPEKNQASGNDDFKTALFDVTKGSQSVQWGGLFGLGYEGERNLLGLTYLYSHTAEDTATLAEDTRGKQFFFPGYDPDDPDSPGFDEPDAAPYLRLETLDYTERTTSSLQLRGDHKLPFGSFDLGEGLQFRDANLRWIASRSSAELYQPDKRQFGSLWQPGREIFPGFELSSLHLPFKPGANFNLGNFQRIFKDIREDSSQVALDLEFPFEQWNGLDGALSMGVFDDSVDRNFNQDTYSNFGDSGASFEGEFDEFWSGNWENEDHPITEALTDVDYAGDIDITAAYGMIDLPLTASLNLVGGARIERTQIGVVNDAEEDAVWFPEGEPAPVTLNPGDADVQFSQTDVLPALALNWEPNEQVALRGSYSQTIARQTFKELTPVVQQEFLGGPIFIGNPDLGMSEIKNYDLRFDYRPYEGGLFSMSYFYKDITDPIEFVQRVALFNFTTAVNYPKGRLSGFEFEVRQDLERTWDWLEGVSLGLNATFIDSQVQLPDDVAAGFDLPGIQAPISSRDLTNAPEHLYNFFLTYDSPETGTQIGLFYTLTGDTLLEGAAQDGDVFIPSIYAKEFGSLNVSLTQKLGKYLNVKFQGKNLTNPDIETVYRSEYISNDVLRSRESAGVDLSVTLSLDITF